MLALPKLILCEIGYYLPLTDLVNLRLAHSKLNSGFDLDYFWQQRSKFDFQCQTGTLSLYRELYWGTKIIFQNQLITCDQLNQQENYSVGNGKIVVFTFHFKGTSACYYIYRDDWHENYDLTQFKYNGIIPIATLYYIPPNQLKTWMTNFKIGQLYSWQSLMKYTEIS